MEKYIVGYLAIISVIAFFMTYYDKRAARKGRRRISEKRLLITSFIGGALFSFIAMLIFRHKTNHIKFMLLLPLFILLHIILLYLLFIK